MAKKVKEETLNLDNILFKCRDILRQAKNSGSFFEKRDMMLTLVFLRFMGEKYEDGVASLRQRLIEEGLDPDDEEIIKAFFDDATFADGTFDLPVEARWSTIINTAAPQLNVALDTALRSIGETNPTLKGCFVEGTFTQRNLGANDMKKIVDEVNKISHKTFGEEKDLIGRVYEYFLKEFAVKGEQKKKVQLITEQIQHVADIYHQWQSEGTDGKDFAIPELYRSVGIDEIEQNNWTLVPSKYIEFIDHDLEIDYPKEMARIQQEMKELIQREKESQKMLEESFKGCSIN